MAMKSAIPAPSSRQMTGIAAPICDLKIKSFLLKLMKFYVL